MKRIFSLILITIFTLSILNTQQAKAYGPASIHEYMSLSTGYGSTFAIKKDNSLWAWGLNNSGQLGDGTKISRNVPVEIMADVKVVSSGSYESHSLAVKTDDSLWAWGANNYGQLGDGTTIARSTPLKIMDHVDTVSAGGEHILIIKTDGSLWAWGQNNSGQLGDGSTTNRATPVKIMDNVDTISAGLWHSLAIKTDGSLWAWGDNQWGQLGDGTTQYRATPVKIMDSVDTVSAGSGHTIAIKTDGSLWAWGLNYSGQLGDGSTTDSATPIKIMDSVDTVSASGHTLAIKTDGSLWAWGQNNSGQLGDGSTTNRATPVKIMDNVDTASASGHTLAIKTDGSLWAWGDNQWGQLGDGTFANKSKSVKIDLTNIRMITDRIVVFNSLGGTYINSVAVAKGNKIAPPPSPTKNKYIFGGWYKDDNLTQRWDFTKDIVTEHTVLYAKWSSTGITVKFISNATIDIPEIVVYSGDPVTYLPAPPTKAGYAFVGWYKDSQLTTPWNFTADKVTKPTSLYAKWSPLPIGTSSVTARPTNAKILVNGRIISFEGYNINDNNYFKLRDIAFAINYTEKQFSVGWDGFYNAIILDKGNYYDAVGGELQNSSKQTNKLAKPSASTLYLDGKVVFAGAYLISDNNYFKLRDLAALLNFNVGWDGSTNTISIDTTQSYTAP